MKEWGYSAPLLHVLDNVFLLADTARDGSMVRPVGMLGDIASHAFPVEDSRTLAGFGIHGILGIEVLGRAEVHPVAAGHQCVGLIGKGGGGKRSEGTQRKRSGNKKGLVHTITPMSIMGLVT